jgi:predicted ribosome quality control (RQC) complex YloA/Tae2 family protein
MVFINGHWENVDNLNDVSRIIRDSFNTDLADAMDKLLTKMEQKSGSLEEELGDEIDDLHDIIEEQAADIETLEDALCSNSYAYSL